MAAMAFDWLGQQALLGRLSQALVTGHVAHAYLFLGPEKCGKRTLARHFAQAILCAHPRSDGWGCGQCADCQRFLSGNHADFIVVEPAEGRKTVTVEQIRGLVRTVAVAPYEGKKRVVLLPRVDGIAPAAQHAMLKTLEEPPQHTVFLLTASAADRVLATVRSRMALLRVPPVPTGDIIAMLRSRGLDEEQARSFAAMADGAPGRALDISENPQQAALRDQALDMLGDLLSAGQAEIARLAAGLAAIKEDVPAVLDAWLSVIRDGWLIKNGRPCAQVDRQVWTQNQIAPLPVLRLAAMARAILEAKRNLEGNASFQMTVDALLIALLEEE
nr:DNA polymerase III subunit delta' [bacterium]